MNELGKYLIVIGIGFFAMMIALIEIELRLKKIEKKLKDMKKAE